MDYQDKQQMAKLILYGILIATAYQLLVSLYHYVVAGLAILGAGYVYTQYQKHRGRW